MSADGARASDTSESGQPALDRKLYALIFAIALLLRFFATAQYQAAHPHAEHPVIDEDAYDRWGRTIAAGDWLGSEVFFQEPLYPYVVGSVYALGGGERLHVRLLQCVLGAALTLIAGCLAARVFGRWAGLVAAALLALYWPLLLFPSLLLKENLFVPLFALFALALVATRTARHPKLAWLCVGLLAGLGVLLRGNMLVLAPAFVLWPLGRAFCENRGTQTAWLRRAGAGAALVLAGIACVLFPVALRNHAVGGVFVLSTSGAGTNFYGGNNLENPHGRASEFSFMRGIPEHEAGDWKHEAERRVGRTLDPSEVSSYWRDEVLRSMRAHPWEHARILWNKLRLTLGRYEVPDNHFLYWDARYVALARLPFPGFGVVGVLGLAGMLLFLARRWILPAPRGAPFEPRDPHAAGELALLFALYLATIVLTVTSERARLPLIVVLAPFGAYALTWIAAALRSPAAARASSWPLPALVLAGVLVHAPVLDAREIAEDYDERDYNLAVQWLGDESRSGAARDIAVDLAARHPRSARMQALIAEADLQRARTAHVQGQRAEARKILDSALARVEPFATDARLNARERQRAQALSGIIQLERGAWTEAAEHFRRALEFDPASDTLRAALARALLAAQELAPSGESVASAREAVALLEAADSGARTGVEQEEHELLLAQAQFQLGRALLAEAHAAEPDPAALEAGKQAIRDALARLAQLARAEHTDVRIEARARALAGWIQLELANLQAAENQFRASLKFAPTASAELGLAQVLVLRAEASADDARAQALEEARTLLERSSVLDPASAPVTGLRERIARLQ